MWIYGRNSFNAVEVKWISQKVIFGLFLLPALISFGSRVRTGYLLLELRCQRGGNNSVRTRCRRSGLWLRGRKGAVRHSRHSLLKKSRLLGCASDLSGSLRNDLALQPARHAIFVPLFLSIHAVFVGVHAREALFGADTSWFEFGSWRLVAGTGSWHALQTAGHVIFVHRPFKFSGLCGQAALLVLRRAQVVLALAGAVLRESAPGGAGGEAEAAGVFRGVHENSVGSEFENANGLYLGVVLCGFRVPDLPMKRFGETGRGDRGIH